ncbi:hypothetical protein ACYULU_02330 [Breznakiellaceae bacterium SP9]
MYCKVSSINSTLFPASVQSCCTPFLLYSGTILEGKIGSADGYVVLLGVDTWEEAPDGQRSFPMGQAIYTIYYSSKNYINMSDLVKCLAEDYSKEDTAREFRQADNLHRLRRTYPLGLGGLTRSP